MDKQEQVEEAGSSELTFPEALAEAPGLTVMSAFKLVYAIFNYEHITCFKSAYGHVPYIWVHGEPGPDGGNWWRFEYEDPNLVRSYLYGPQINLANLLVRDCWEALPQKVLSALAEGLGSLLGRTVAEPQAPSTTSHQTEKRFRPNARSEVPYWQTMKIGDLKDGEPCPHPGCLSHVTHPCENCGRIAGRGGSTTGFREGRGVMTILEIRDRVEAGETIRISTKYWKLFHEQTEAHIDRACWHMSVANGVITITKEGVKSVD